MFVHDNIRIMELLSRIIQCQEGYSKILLLLKTKNITTTHLTLKMAKLIKWIKWIKLKELMAGMRTQEIGNTFKVHLRIVN